MKDTFLAILLILLAVLPLTRNAFAQESPQWHLPEGATARLGKGSINEIAYSPDSTRLAVASSIGIWMYDPQTGEALDLLAPNTGVDSMSFSPDGQILATGNGDGNVRLWHATTGELLQTISRYVPLGSFSGEMKSVVFSPDGNILAVSSSRNTMFLWDVNTGKQLHSFMEYRYKFNYNRIAPPIAFSPDGNILASSVGEYVDEEVKISVFLRDVNTGETLLTLTGHTGIVSSISFSPDGATLATGSRDEIRFWDVNTGETLQEITGHHSLHNVSFSPDGNTLAYLRGHNEVLLWDVNTSKLRTFTGTGSIYSVSFSPDGNTLAIREGTKVLLWDVNTGKLRTFTGTSSIYDPHKKVNVGFSPAVYSVSFSPDGNTLAIGGNWKTDILNANTGAPIHTFFKISCRIESVVFSPDGNTLAGGGSDRIVRLWDIKTGTEKQIPTGQIGDARVAFSPDGNRLATVPDIGGAVRLWDVNTGKPLRQFTADGSGLSRIYSMAFSPDGNTLATGSSDYDYIGGWLGTVTLWDVNTGETLQTLTGHTDTVSSISFSPDGSMLATGSRDEIRIWDVNTGETLQTLIGHTHEVSSISFSPDGSMLATGSRDGAVLLWELTPFSPENERITADINADGTVNVQDLVIVANAFGKAEPDLNGDGVVNIQDLVIVANAF